MLATPREKAGQEHGGAQHGEQGHRIALDGAGALHGLAAGNAGQPGALLGSVVAPIRHNPADIARHIPGIMGQGAADMAGLAPEIADLGGKRFKGIVAATAVREQIVKTHGLLPGYGRNAIGRTQVPSMVDDFASRKDSMNTGSRTVTI